MTKEKGLRPFAVAPVLQHPGVDTMTILWETHEDVRGGIVYRRPGQPDICVEGASSGRFNRITLTDLDPASVYEYDVTINGATVFKSTFKTLPRSGPYRVVILSDLHAPAEGFRMLLPHIEEAKPDFIVVLGDLVLGSQYKDNWISFFELGRELFDHIPFTTAIGNHDVKHQTEFYDRYVGRLNGAPEGYYYFTSEVADDYYIFLDSRNDLLFFHQGFWLIKRLRELAARDDIRHVFVFSHLGPVSYKGLRQGFIGLKPLLPFMGKIGVSAIFSGHDHHYIRGDTHWGFPFFITGGGGGPLYSFEKRSPYAWMVGKRQCGIISYQFLVLDVGDGGAVVRAVDTDGSVIDTVDLLSKRK